MTGSVIVGLAYSNIDIIKSSLASISENTLGVPLFVIENRSADTEGLIRPYLLDGVDHGSIAGYFDFDENVTNNAFELAFDSGLIDFGSYDYVTLTDFDLLVYGEWLPDHIGILDGHPEVFSVSAPLSYDNMPDAVRAGVDPKYFQPTSVQEGYDVFPSGLHLTTLRGSDFVSFLRWRARTGAHFRDRVLESFGGSLRRVSARSRITPVRHLTWDMVVTTPSYQAEKFAKGKNLWMHDETSPFTYHSASAKTRVHPGSIEHAPTTPRWHHIKIVNDTNHACVIDISRVWRDGHRDGQRPREIPVGLQSDFDVLHHGFAWGSIEVQVRALTESEPASTAIIRLNEHELDALDNTIVLGEYVPRTPG